jgi:hypothetical protein
MTTTVVILQPQYFPWGGVFEQIRAADIYVHYDDVQFSKGYFNNRVQVKTAQGSAWMTVPVRHDGFTPINKMKPDAGQPWARKHFELLRQSLARAPHAADALAIAEPILKKEWDSLAELAIAGTEAAAEYLDFKPKFYRSSQLSIGGESSQRVFDICKHFNADVYVTGHGAKNYMDHELFDAAGIRIEYMDYEKRPYPQLHGDFTPYVTILDLIANCGKQGRDYLASKSRYWREILPELKAKTG